MKRKHLIGQRRAHAGARGAPVGRPAAWTPTSFGRVLRWLAFGAALGCAAAPEAGAAEKAPAKLEVKDVLTAPLKEVAIEVHLVEPGLLREAPLGGEVVEFFIGAQPLPRAPGDSGIEWRRLGQELTGGDGRAFLRYTPRVGGHFHIRAEFPGSKRAMQAEATGLLASWERRRPIVFIEVDALMEPRAGSIKLLPGLELPVGSGALTTPAADAAQQLERLTRFYFYSVYVIRSPGIQVDEFRQWLGKHRFPPGLTRTISPGKDGLEELLADLSEQGFDNIKGGIGRSRDFAELFASRRKTIVVLSESGEAQDYPRKTKWAKDWLDVRKHLQG